VVGDDNDIKPMISRVLLTTILFSTIGMTAEAQSANIRIDKTSFVSLGGLEQWISIRGEDRSNPGAAHRPRRPR